MPTAGGKEIKIDHDTLDDIVKKLEKDLHDLEKQRYSEQIQDGTPPEGALGNYKAGQSLHGTFRAARDSIGDTYDQFIASYKQVIEAIRNSDKTHRKADDASKRGVEAAGSPNSYI
ncbi:hypothetical protein HUT06_05860 [Actinomadura sp. NAK00032]|uniref:hypothetical protein n=1 Tax=Actinomadura sp. NAK00032 TaxID=2742128 RepID=UPI001590A4AF|nr:hypothetical protein [Actinomadura sp. NAK00032]QKW33614.1 hypothetical protein HUT06_05860 [Actinomadura sp. NAK00032]